MAKKNKAIIAVLIAVVVAGGGYTVISTINGVKNTMSMMGGQYSVIEAGENDLSKTISSNGKIIGNGTVEVTTKLTAEVSEVNVSLGDHVKNGDVLCVFDNTEIQEQYDDLKKQIDNSDKKTENSHAKSKRDLEDAKTKKQKALSRAQRAINKAVKERDQAYADYNALVADYNAHMDSGDEEYDYAAADAALAEMYAGLSALDEAVTTARETYTDTAEQYDETIQTLQDAIDEEEFEVPSDSEKELQKLEERLEECTVVAPQDGVITTLNVNEGTIPQAASLMTIVNMDKTVVELTVGETDITKISEGMSAVVTSKVLPDEDLPAKITRIVNVLSEDSLMTGEGASGGGYKVEVTLDTANDKLMIGMSASVEITLENVGKKLSVPYSGVVDEDGKSYVYVATPDKQAEGMYTVKKKEITVGAESDVYTEVVSGDIKEGDLIVE
ncbi:MAG: efflux RND transporter periplasmic adaptor subunit, partial [Ruminococcus sp.]|nr:efflux RND transporter periplasmic adaptor subunit [Ruminococcus sp.]